MTLKGALWRETQRNTLSYCLRVESLSDLFCNRAVRTDGWSNFWRRGYCKTRLNNCCKRSYKNYQKIVESFRPREKLKWLKWVANVHLSPNGSERCREERTSEPVEDLLGHLLKKKMKKKRESFFSSSRIPCSHSVMEGIKWPKSSQSGLWQKKPALRSSCADASRRVRHHFVTELMPQKKSSVQIYEKNCFKKLLFMETRSHLRSNFEK